MAVFFFAIIKNFWIFLVPILSFSMLYIKSEVIFELINPRLPKNTHLFVFKYISWVYGHTILYGLNLAHIVLFTLWGFILRFSVIGDITVLQTYLGYFLFYFVFGVGLRILDNMMCFLFIKYLQRGILLTGGSEFFQDDFDDNRPVDIPPSPRPRSNFHSSMPPQGTPPYKQLYSRILTGKNVKGACIILGTCFAAHVSWEAYRANNIAQQGIELNKETHAYNVFKSEREFLYARYKDKDIDRPTYQSKLDKLEEEYYKKR